MSEVDTLDEAAQAAAARPPADVFGRVLWALNAFGTVADRGDDGPDRRRCGGAILPERPDQRRGRDLRQGYRRHRVPAASCCGAVGPADTGGFPASRWRIRAPRAAALLEVLFAAVGVFVFVVIFRAAWPQFVEALERAEFFGVQGVWTLPTWPIRGAILLGCAGAAAAALLHGIAHLLKVFRR